MPMCGVGPASAGTGLGVGCVRSPVPPRAGAPPGLPCGWTFPSAPWTRGCPQPAVSRVRSCHPSGLFRLRRGLGLCPHRPPHPVPPCCGLRSACLVKNSGAGPGCQSSSGKGQAARAALESAPPSLRLLAGWAVCAPGGARHLVPQPGGPGGCGGLSGPQLRGPGPGWRGLWAADPLTVPAGRGGACWITRVCPRLLEEPGFGEVLCQLCGRPSTASAPSSPLGFVLGRRRGLRRGADLGHSWRLCGLSWAAWRWCGPRLGRPSGAIGSSHGPQVAQGGGL